jgi:hypothetical protein
MRAASTPAWRGAVAIALLVLFAAPVARAALERGGDSHSCCPQSEAPQPVSGEPCQQIAATSCCLEVGVPQTARCDEALAAPLLALRAAPWTAAPSVPETFPGPVARRVDAPRLPPLARTGVLLI